VLGRGDSGNLRRKQGQELVEVIKKKLAFTWGGFAPTTAGHESIMDAAAAMGFAPEDFIALVGANEGIKAGDPSSYRTAVFDQDFRVLLAKAGFGAKGATVLPKPRDFEVPQGFDISEGTGRRKVILPQKGSRAFVADKTPEQMAKYKDAGYDVTNLERTGGISGTMVRDLIMSGKIDQLQDVLSPGVYDIISKNLPILQNRANVLPEIIKQVQASQQSSVDAVEKQITDIGIKRINRKQAESDPEYAAKIALLEELRKKKTKLQSAGAFEPYRLLDKLASDQPDKYGLKFAQGGLIQKFMAGEMVQKLPAPARKIIDALGGLEPAAKIGGVRSTEILEILKKKVVNQSQKTIQDKILAQYAEVIGAEQQAMDQAMKFGLVGLFGETKVGTNDQGRTIYDPKWDYSKQFGPEDIGGRNTTIIARGLRSQYAEAVYQMQREIFGVNENFARNLETAGGFGAQSLANIQGPAVKAGQAGIEGAMIELVLARLGAPLRENAPANRPIDYPDGLGDAAKFFGIDPDMPTEVKRTINGDSLARTREEIERYYKEVLQVFATGGKVKLYHGSNTGINDSVLNSFKEKGALSNIAKGYGQGEGFYLYTEKNKAQQQANMRVNGGSNFTVAQGDRSGKPMVLTFNEQLSPKDYDLDYELQKGLVVQWMHDNYDTLKDKYAPTENQTGLKGKFDKNPDAGMMSVGVSIQEGSQTLKSEDGTEFTLPGGSRKSIYAGSGGDVREGALLGQLMSRIQSGDPELVNSFESKLFEKPLGLALKYVGSSPLKPSNIETFADGGSVEGQKKEKNFGKIGIKNNGSEIIAAYLGTKDRSGMVSAKKMADNLYTVGLSKASEGYGPKLYDIVMEAATANGGMLAPDRNIVSDAAKGVWSYYFNNRSDVRKTPLDRNQWTQNSALIDPKLLGDKNTWPPYSDPAWILQSGYSKNSELLNSSDIVNLNDDKYKSFLQSQQLSFFAQGGSVEDTVPALLTPGEFVINKKAAQKIGYGKLKKLNHADKIQGYNRGGIVHRFADGDVVPPSGPGSGGDSDPTIRDLMERIRQLSEVIDRLSATVRDSSDTRERTPAERPERRPRTREEILDRYGSRVINNSFRSMDRFTTRLNVLTGVVGVAANFLAETIGEKSAVGAVVQSFANSITTASGTVYSAAGAIKGAYEVLPEGVQELVRQRIGSFTAGGGFGTTGVQAAGGAAAGLAIAAATIYAGIEAFKAYNDAIRKQTEEIAKNNMTQGLEEFDKALELYTKNTTDNAFALKVAGEQLAKATSAALTIVNLNKTNPDRGYASIIGENIGTVGGGLVGGAVGGATAGATIGTVIFPGVGTVIGALLGTAIGATAGYASDQAVAYFSGRGGQEQISQRSEIANRFGTGAYTQSLFDSNTQTNLSRSLASVQAAETAATLTPVRQRQDQYFEQLFKSGVSESEIQSAPEWQQQAELIARSNAATEEQLRLIDADLSVSKELRDAKKQEIIASTASAELRKQAEQVRIQREQERAADESKSYMVSLERSFQNMEQAMDSTSYSIDKLRSSAELSAAALQGQAKIGKVTLDAIDVIRNPNVASRQEKTQAYGLAGSLMGSQGKSVTGLLEYGSNIEGRILSSINNALAENSKGSSEKIGAAVNRSVANEIEGLDIGDSLKQKLASQTSAAVSKMRTDGDEKIDFDDLADKVPGLAKVVDATKRAQEMAVKRLEFFQQSLNEYSESINSLAELQYNIGERLRRVNNLRIKSEEDLSRALGKSTSFEATKSNVRSNVQSLAGTTDPRQIFENLANLEQQRQQQQSRVTSAANRGAVQEYVVMTNQLKTTTLQMRENHAALKELAESSDVASAALNKINDIQQQNAARTNILERYVTSTPQEQNQLSSAFERLQNNMDGATNSMWDSVNVQKAYRDSLTSGSTQAEAMNKAQEAAAQDRKETLDAFNMIAPLLGDQQNELKANVLESMMRESGVQMSPLFEKALQGLRNPERDPQMDAAIKEYQEANRLQQEANVYLAMLDGKVAQDMATKSDELLRTSLATVTQKFELAESSDVKNKINSIDSRLRDGIKVFPQGNIGGGSSDDVTTAAKGGYITYKAVGGSIFKPKGTDTVPAMLTPGEFVVNRSATQKHGSLLESINSGQFAKGGKVTYRAAGGIVGDVKSPHLKDFSDPYEDLRGQPLTGSFFSKLGSSDDVSKNLLYLEQGFGALQGYQASAYPTFNNSGSTADGLDKQSTTKWIKDNRSPTGGKLGWFPDLTVFHGSAGNLGYLPIFWGANAIAGATGATVTANRKSLQKQMVTKDLLDLGNPDIFDVLNDRSASGKGPRARTTLLSEDQAKLQKEKLTSIFDQVDKGLSDVKQKEINLSKDGGAINSAANIGQYGASFRKYGLILGSSIPDKYMGLSFNKPNTSIDQSLVGGNLSEPSFSVTKYGYATSSTSPLANSTNTAVISGGIQTIPTEDQLKSFTDKYKSVIQVEEWRAYIDKLDKDKSRSTTPIEEQTNARNKALRKLINNQITHIQLKEEDLSDEFKKMAGIDGDFEKLDVYSEAFKGRWPNTESMKTNFGIKDEDLKKYWQTGANDKLFTLQYSKKLRNLLTGAEFDQQYTKGLPWSWGENSIFTAETMEAVKKEMALSSGASSFKVIPKVFSKSYTDTRDPNQYTAKIKFPYDSLSSLLFDKDSMDYTAQSLTALVPWWENQQKIDPFSINPFVGLAQPNAVIPAYQDEKSMEKFVKYWVEKEIFNKPSIYLPLSPIKLPTALDKFVGSVNNTTQFDREVTDSEGGKNFEQGNYVPENAEVADISNALFKKYEYIYAKRSQDTSANNESKLRENLLQYNLASSLGKSLLKKDGLKLPLWDPDQAFVTADPVWQAVKDTAPDLGVDGYRNAAEWKRSYILAAAGTIADPPDKIKADEDIFPAQNYIAWIRAKTVEAYSANEESQDKYKQSGGVNISSLGKLVSAWRFMEESRTAGGSATSYKDDNSPKDNPFSKRLYNRYEKDLKKFTKKVTLQAPDRNKKGDKPWERDYDDTGAGLERTYWDNAKLASDAGFVQTVLSEQEGKIDDRRARTLLSYRRGYKKDSVQPEEQAILDAYGTMVDKKGREDIAFDLTTGGANEAKAPTTFTGPGGVYEQMMDQYQVMQIGRRSMLRALIEDRARSNFDAPNFENSGYEEWWEDMSNDLEYIEEYLSARDYMLLKATSSAELYNPAVGAAVQAKISQVSGGLPDFLLNAMPGLTGGADYNSLYGTVVDNMALSAQEFVDSITGPRPVDPSNPTLGTLTDDQAQRVNELRKLIATEFGQTRDIKPSVYTQEIFDMYKTYIEDNYNNANKAYSKLNEGTMLQPPNEIWDRSDLVVLADKASANSPNTFRAFYLASVGAGKNLAELKKDEMQGFGGLLPSAQKGAEALGMSSAEPDKKSQPQTRASGGLIYNQSYKPNNIDWSAKGTDTVPAMLTPGEFVINKDSSQRYMPILEAINQGNYTQGNIVQYASRGGTIRPIYRNMGGIVGGNQQQGVLNSYIGLDEKSIAALRDFTAKFDQFAKQLLELRLPTIGIDSTSLGALTTFSNRFDEFSKSLLKLNIPPVITINAKHDVNVNINGASVFNNLNAYVSDIVKSEIDKAFSQLAKVSENAINLYGS
jgi:hypothetical protein